MFYHVRILLGIGFFETCCTERGAIMAPFRPTAIGGLNEARHIKQKS
jgi:hypothetical protein